MVQRGSYRRRRAFARLALKQVKRLSAILADGEANCQQLDLGSVNRLAGCLPTQHKAAISFSLAGTKAERWLTHNEVKVRIEPCGCCLFR